MSNSSSNNFNKKETALALIDQLVAMYKVADSELCKYYLLINKASRTIGTSQIEASLLALKELVSDLEPAKAKLCCPSCGGSGRISFDKACDRCAPVS